MSYLSEQIAAAERGNAGLIVISVARARALDKVLSFALSTCGQNNCNCPGAKAMAATVRAVID